VQGEQEEQGEQGEQGEQEEQKDQEEEGEQNHRRNKYKMSFSQHKELQVVRTEEQLVGYAYFGIIICYLNAPEF
jgi:hypothetical protein